MSKLLEQINSEIETKEIIPLASLMTQITSKVDKIQKSDYLKSGLVPIYDQGDNDVSGYSNDVKNAYNGKLPVVIFGDHTLRLRRISSPFYLGADGNQLIEPTDDNVLDRNYFYYLLLSKKPRSYGYERHFKYLKEVEVKVPSLSTQKKIAEILSAYDAKIENNNFIIKKLEATAQTLFDEWFVNFRFPGYEKSKFVDSEMGEIPEGWNVGQVKDLIKVESGFPFSSNVFDKNGKYKLVTIRNVQDGEFVPDCDNGISELPEKLPDYCKLKTGDILLSLTGNVGRVCLVIGNDYVLNQRVAKLVPIDENNKPFAYFLFRKKEFQNLLINMAKGSAQPNLSPVDTKNMEIIIPEKGILKNFNRVTLPFLRKIVELKEENISLKSQRDQLLAKLI